MVSFLVWVIFTFEIVKVGLFEKRKIVLNFTASIGMAVVLAGALYGAWKLSPPAKDPPSLDQQLDALAKRFPWLTKPPPSGSSPATLNDPVLHVDIPSDEVFSTGAKEKQGVFTATLSNTGLEDVYAVQVQKDYFVAESSGPDVTFKRLGDDVVSVLQLLKGQKQFVSIDFNPYTYDARQVMTNFQGPCVEGVKVSVYFRRRADGKNFSFSTIFGILNPTAPLLYAENSGVDRQAMGGNLSLGASGMLIISDGRNYFTDSVNAGDGNQQAITRPRLKLSQIKPFVGMPERWLPVMKEIDGSNVTKIY
jgi:hypothetical protein